MLLQVSGYMSHLQFQPRLQKIYLDGVAVINTGNMTGKTISWANCTNISIGSGAPGFIAWNHLSDLSKIDELYLFDKVLTVAEIQAIMNN